MDIEVSVGSRRNAIVGVNKWRGTLQVRIAEAPERGRANDELRGFLSEVLDLGSSDITIVKGSHSHRKKVFVKLSPAEVVRRVGRLI